MCQPSLHQMLSSAKEQCNIVTSFGTVISLRSFFLVTPSEREKLECLCTTCLNTRLVFDVVMGKVKDVQQKFKSITKYFTNRKECMMTRSGNFSIDCINNLCKYNCGLISPDYQFEFANVKFYQYEVVQTENRKRTQRVPYDINIQECKKNAGWKGTFPSSSPFDDITKRY